MKPHPLREEARRLRQSGMSILDIARCLPMAKSTVSLAVRDIQLTQPQSDRLDESNRANQAAFVSRLSQLDPEVRAEQRHRSGLATWQKHEEQMRANLTKGTAASGLTYRKDELPFLSILNKLYSTTFRKEQIGTRYFDFCDDEYVIELTFDHTHGVSDVLARFEESSKWILPRQRIAYIPSARCTSPRIQRLSLVVDKILDSHTLL